MGAVGLTVLTLALTAVRDRLALSTVFLIYLCLIVGIAALGGWWPAVVGSVAAFLLVNWYFVPPLHQWDVGSAENAFALGAFVAVGGVVSLLDGHRRPPPDGGGPVESRGRGPHPHGRGGHRRARSVAGTRGPPARHLRRRRGRGPEAIRPGVEDRSGLRGASSRGARGGHHLAAARRRRRAGPAGRTGGRRGPGGPRRLLGPPGGGGAQPGARGGGGDRRPGGFAQPAAVHDPERGVARPAHPAVVHQGRGLQPPPDRHRLERGRPRGVPGHDRGGGRPAELAGGQPPRHEPSPGRGPVPGAAPHRPRRGRAPGSALVLRAGGPRRGGRARDRSRG